jgi:competence protein ComGC
MRGKLLNVAIFLVVLVVLALIIISVLLTAAITHLHTENQARDVREDAEAPVAPLLHEAPPSSALPRDKPVPRTVSLREAARGSPFI